MNVVRKCEVVIAGAGPAGLAAALHLMHAEPRLAGRIVAIERAKHPRLKVCAGGLIPRAIEALDELGMQLDVPAVEVFAATAQTEVGTIELGSAEPLCTIVRRDQFDAMLARKAREAGVEIIEETRVLGVEQCESGASIATQRGIFEAQVLLGADGSGSRVRSAVFGRTKHNIGRALITEVPMSVEGAAECVRRVYRFDFNCVAAGVNGYCWSFPCLINGQPYLNLGIYDQNPHERAGWHRKPDLPGQLRMAFPEIDLHAETAVRVAFKAFPIRWYDGSDQYVRGRTILAGDAAGVDPFMGEGISCAFEHGKLAATALARFLNGDSLALEAYGNELHSGLMGRKLRRLAFAARRFYGPRHRIYFRLAALSKRAQQLGVDWYNGARGADGLSVAQALLRLCSSVLFETPPR
jgi:flavin-dependent dehydrogenase